MKTTIRIPGLCFTLHPFQASSSDAISPDPSCTSRLRKWLLASIACLFFAGCGGQVELLSDLGEQEANEVLASLIEANVRAIKSPGKDGTVKLAVDSTQVGRAMTVLRNEGLPRERFAKMGEVFRKEGMISSPVEERARYLWALSQELSATVSQIDGVVRARVHVVLPERSVGNDPSMPSSAAVFIKHKRGYNLDDSVPQVRKLVANSIPGLSLEKVTVVLLSAAPKPTDAMTASHTRVWGIAVPNQAAATLSGLLWTLLSLLLLALGAIGLLTWRLFKKPTMSTEPAQVKLEPLPRALPQEETA